MAAESDLTPITLQEILREGGRVSVILLFWGILAALGRYGIGNIGLARPGRFFFEVGNSLAALFIIAGIVSILIYAIARGIQLSHR